MGNFFWITLWEKSFELDIELEQTFFLPSDPESLAIFYRFISFIKEHREFPDWSSDSGHWLESSTNETSLRIFAVDF